jgi:hypothetical protein
MQNCGITLKGNFPQKENFVKFDRSSKENLKI